MKKGNLFSTIAFIFSIMLLIVSGAIYVYSAQQQSVSSSLQVTYEARNVSFTADAWYQKPSNNARQAFTGNTLSVSATAAESTTNTLSVADPITINANPDTYVLFTYKFVNTASNGGYDMLVSLTDGATKTNVNVKYYTSVTSDTNPSMYSTLSSQKDTVDNNGISLVPAPISVPAQSSLLYYILVEIDDNTISSTYATGNNNEITWNVSSANTWEEQHENVKLYVTAPQGYSSGYTYAIFENDTCILYEDAVSNFELTVSYGSEIYISYGYGISYTQHVSWNDNYLPQSFVSYYQPDGKSLRLTTFGSQMHINIESTNIHYSGSKLDFHYVNFRATDTSYTITLGS